MPLIDVLVLRDLPILGEGLEPVRLRQRRHVPTIGCHSVMESPEPVSRVAPPMLTITNTSAATASEPSADARNIARLFRPSIIQGLRVRHRRHT